MRRRHVVFGVFAALLLTAPMLSGCATPVGGEAGAGRPEVIGSVAGTGGESGTVAAAPSRKAAPHKSHGARRRSTPTPSKATPSHPPVPSVAPTHPAPKSHAPSKAARPPAKAKTAPKQTQAPTASLPEFAVCLSLYQLARAPNTAFRRLPRHASPAARSRVGRSYASTHRAMVLVLQRSGLPRRDIVRVRGVAVAAAMDAIARALPTGRGVSNGALREALLGLSTACAR